MKGVNFPIFKTKVEGINQNFNLNDIEDRKRYFELKAGSEINWLKNYFANGGTFIAYLVGVKNSGKGTYSKLFMEAVGSDYVYHLSIGDLVRDVHNQLEKENSEEILEFFKKNYRGPYPLSELKDLILGRSTTKLIPSELILTLIKFEISRHPKKILFIDGFPRAQDQITYSLFLKELVGYRDDPDFIILIDVAESIIDERIKYRVICPKCQTPRNLKLLPTKFVGYDEEKKEFYLKCDNPTCEKARMIQKEGDSLGIEPLRSRLETDQEIFKQLLNLTGIPKIYLRNTVPVDKVDEYVDSYEITPAYFYQIDKNSGEIKIIEKPWIVTDDNGVDCYSLLPAAVEISLIKQLYKLLNER